ncbi:MAG: MerC domain-containing protein [Pseudomonadales bacterium]|nr:MerC domain-containing protein [Pseudomonadales bacterium]
MNLTPEQSPQDPQREKWLDGLAVFLSMTCMVHCLVLPLVVTIFPIVQGSLLEEEDFHLLMLVLILPASLLALTIGCRKHKDKLTMTLGGTGLVILTLTALWGHDWFGYFGERIVTTVGGLILALAHIQNYRSCRTVHCQHDDQHEH